MSLILTRMQNIRAKANLDKLVPVFKEYADTEIDIFGYTDSTGSPEFNLSLSQKRAESVQRYLIQNLEVPSKQLKALGFGEQHPIESNATKVGRAKNRRIEFKVLSNE